MARGKAKETEMGRAKVMGRVGWCHQGRGTLREGAQ